MVKQDPACAETIRYVMLRMIAVGGGELARRRVPLSELKYPPQENKRVKEIIKSFSAARLLVEGQNTEGRPYVEPTHDALIRGWQKLLLWKQEEEESIILQRRLTPVAQEWKNLECEQKRSGLLTKTEPVINWVDARLYTVENLFYLIKAQLFKLVRRIYREQNRLIGKPEEFLWNANPYLNVLKEKLNSSHYLFNQIEAEFLKISIRRKRNISRRSNIYVILMLTFIGLAIYAIVLVIKAETEVNLAKTETNLAKTEANLAKRAFEQVKQESKKVFDSSKRAIENTEKVLNSKNQSLEETRTALEDSNQALEDSNQTLEETQQALEETRQALEETQQALERNNQNQNEQSETDLGESKTTNPQPETDLGESKTTNPQSETDLGEALF